MMKAVNTRNFSLHLYNKDGKWFICRNEQCQSFALLNFLTSRKTLLSVALIAVIAATVAIAPGLWPKSKASSAVMLPEHTEIKDSIPSLTEENLLVEIKKAGIVCEKHVLAQAKLESLHLTSYLCRTANNLFGMRYPGKRPTTAIGIYLQGKDTIIYGKRAELRKYLNQPTYAVYASWVDAVKDYKLWQDNAFKLEERYLTFLNGIYAEAPDYVSVVDRMAKKIQD